MRFAHWHSASRQVDVTTDSISHTRAHTKRASRMVISKTVKKRIIENLKASEKQAGYLSVGLKRNSVMSSGLCPVANSFEYVNGR